LLDCAKVDEAFSLAQAAPIQHSRKTVLLQKIHKKAVFVRLDSFELNLCRESIIESGIDLREV